MDFALKLFVAWMAFDLFCLLVWMAYVELRDKYRLRKGTLLLVDYSIAHHEDAAIKRAREVLSS